jgi:hypothetical protein
MKAPTRQQLSSSPRAADLDVKGVLGRSARNVDADCQPDLSDQQMSEAGSNPVGRRGVGE